MYSDNINHMKKLLYSIIISVLNCLHTMLLKGQCEVSILGFIWHYKHQ